MLLDAGADINAREDAVPLNPARMGGAQKCETDGEVFSLPRRGDEPSRRRALGDSCSPGPSAGGTMRSRRSYEAPERGRRPES